VCKGRAQFYRRALFVAAGYAEARIVRLLWMNILDEWLLCVLCSCDVHNYFRESLLSPYAPYEKDVCRLERAWCCCYGVALVMIFFPVGQHQR